MNPARSRWAPLIGFVVVSSANQMAWLTFAPVATGAAHRYGVSTSTIGLLSEVFPLVYVLAAIPVGRALDRSLRWWLGAGALLSAVGTLVRLGGASRWGFAWVLAGQVLVAAAQPLLLNSIVALARRYLTPADRPAGIAVASAGTFLGFVLAFVTGGALGAGRLTALLVLGAACACLGAAVLVPALAAAPALVGRLEDAADVSASGDRTVPQQAGMSELRLLWADPIIRGLVYFVFVGFGVFVALVTWVQPLLQPAGVSTTTTDTLLTVMVIAGAASSVALPPLVARRGLQLPSLVAAGIAGIAGCLLLAVAPALPAAAVALVLMGLLLLPGMPVMLEIAERTSEAGPAGSSTTVARRQHRRDLGGRPGRRGPGHPLAGLLFVGCRVPRGGADGLPASGALGLAGGDFRGLGRRAPRDCGTRRPAAFRGPPSPAAAAAVRRSAVVRRRPPSSAVRRPSSVVRRQRRPHPPCYPARSAAWSCGTGCSMTIWVQIGAVRPRICTRFLLEHPVRHPTALRRGGRCGESRPT